MSEDTREQPSHNSPQLNAMLLKTPPLTSRNFEQDGSETTVCVTLLLLLLALPAYIGIQARLVQHIILVLLV